MTRKPNRATFANLPLPESLHLSVSGVQDRQIDSGQPLGAPATPPGHCRTKYRQGNPGPQTGHRGKDANRFTAAVV